MHRSLNDILDEKEVHDFQSFLYELAGGEKKYLLRNDILLAFEKFCSEPGRRCSLENSSSAYRLLRQTPELIISDGAAILLHRYQLARYRIYKIHIHSGALEEISTADLLDFQDRFAGANPDGQEEKLRIDFMPFYDYGPNIKDVKRIGKGIEYLNKYMSSSLFQNPDKWHTALFEFLKIHSIDQQQLLIDGDYIRTVQELTENLEKAIHQLEEYDPQTSHAEIFPLLRRNGFEPGWGDTAGRVRETMHLLRELFLAPDSQSLEQFISRIPMINRIAIISPHGWFGQENVLGRPDTGGQVVYILDQVRALEKYLTERIRSYGLSITPKIIILTRLIPEHQNTNSHQRLEKVHYTENSFILRVPFTDKQGQIVPRWLSRFEIWPYLERFAQLSYHELQSEFNGRPDLIIGNYSDGNLVAMLLSKKFGVTQCNIAHALEKTKYLFSDLYWQHFEQEYHFSLQFVADLISMNMSDFIITSTFQEISGAQEGRGQYESYQFFTMPGLFQVENGINLFHPKFNVIPPGVEENVYFPYDETGRRLPKHTRSLEELLFSTQNETVYGTLDDPGKRPIFSMSRLDRIKNITGLVEGFGQSPELQEKANLILIAGKIKTEETDDAEERTEIERMYSLIDQYQLQGKIRWLGVHLPKEDGGEVYRIIADREGIFVQPARFEGFGLTVLEAMASGLPTFATQFGGPSEIIVPGKSGFLINPTLPELISRPLLEFLGKLEQDSSLWKKISRQAIQRVQENFTWRLYSERLLNLTALYGFWRYSVAGAGRQGLALYCHLLFQLFFKPRARELENR